MACEKKCLQRSEIQIETCRGLPTLAYGSRDSFELLTATTPSIFRSGCFWIPTASAYSKAAARSENPNTHLIVGVDPKRDIVHLPKAAQGDPLDNHEGFVHSLCLNLV